ncbi:MAG: adenylate/guanylate cyclase domain-containing protein, partial [Alphaproteobacteria bacterium]
LTTGLVMVFFVITHFLNHALGLISLEVMESGRLIFIALWRNTPATILLMGSILIHMALALHAIYARRRLRFSTADATQLILGLLIPPLLVIHILGTRGAYQSLGVDDQYALVLLPLWVDAAQGGLKQLLASTIVWIHGCIGMHMWLRLKQWYQRFIPTLFALALLLPTFGMLGFVSAGREVALLDAQAGWRAELAVTANAPNAGEFAEMLRRERAILIGLAVLLTMTLLARGIRVGAERRHKRIRLQYPDGRRIEVPPGTTILDASRIHGIPHAAVCGGRGRCSTCRVRVAGNVEALPPPSLDEQRVLARIKAAPDVRLACQTRPCEDLSVTPLLSPAAGPRQSAGRARAMLGQEREIAVLFADIRGFTTLSEQKLPYDVVFILNRYFQSMGEAVDQAGGRIDKFIGDGVMALFGIDTTPDTACQQALRAATAMAVKLEELNEALEADLPAPLRIGIGIHAGAAIVGEMGYGSATGVTAIGDTVNTASRLEALTKEHKAQLIISHRVVELAGIHLANEETVEQAVRGRAESLRVHVFKSAMDIEGLKTPQPQTNQEVPA